MTTGVSTTENIPAAVTGEPLNIWAWLKIALVSLVIGILYATVLKDMATDWWTDPSLSQGLLIPPLALYVAWLHRQRTFSAPVAPSYSGLLLTAGACLLFLLGKVGAEFFISRMSFVLLLVGLTWTFWGWARVQTLAFPFLLLATMVPLPVIVYNALAAPLQLLASEIATSLAQALGVTVYRDGNIINLANISLGVEEACSGLNSLSALMVGGLLLGYLQCTRVRTRALLFALTIPLSIAVNILRVTGTALLADVHQEFALGFYHSFSGWLVFLGGFGILYALGKGLHRLMD